MGMQTLTGLLRRQVCENSLENDICDLSIKRKLYATQLEILRRKRARGPLQQVQAQQKQLSWKQFAQGAEESEKRKIRPVFNSFIKCVQEMAGGSLSSGDLYHGAHIVYKGCLHDKKLALTEVMGFVPDALYQQAKQLIDELEEWKATAVTEQNEPAQTRGKHGEFGSEIEFRHELKDMDEDEDWSEDEDEDEEDYQGTLGMNRGDSTDERLGWVWLTKKCEKLATFSSEGEPLVTEQYLASSALAILQSSKSDNAIQNDLLDLLGGDSFELLSKLLSNRKVFKGVRVGDKDSWESDGSGGMSVRAKGGGRNLVGVTISSTKRERFDKRRKKEDRRMMRKSQKPNANSREIDEEKLDQQANLLKDWKKDFTPGARGICLPPNAKKSEYKMHTEVFVPAAIPKPVEESELVPISTLEEYAQLAFQGTKTLNRMQSKCYEAAYKRNENLLICAPTGAGKTNVAMLSVLQEVGNHIHAGVLQKDQFKIIYVAPMKALAQEVQGKFQRRLAPLGITVKELTGDVQMTKREIQETQMIVTTPEKWDVMTRKSGDGSLIQMVRLLIIDEVHLLHEERGPVIEILVARTSRMVESSQEMCRIVGLSATLPNYEDVAVFLGVNPRSGLFFFDQKYRPVPLSQEFIGIKEKNPIKRRTCMSDMAYQKTLKSLREGNQVMVFVNSRKDTDGTAKHIRDFAKQAGTIQHFQCIENPRYEQGIKKVSRSKNPMVRELFADGFGCHHAGMVRSDRTLVETMFAQGLIKVLVCTATLAWGVNLPAHTVIMKGTQLYNAKRGGWVDVGMLDVMQIFGRAGRPQYDTTGEAIMITAHDSLNHYLSLLTAQMPIESQFIEALPNHLNAEIILGTVTNLKEAISWLTYTYLYTRMLRNPMHYGVSYDEKQMDPLLLGRRRGLVVEAAKTLMRSRMVKFDCNSGNFFPTDLGRVASHYYIHHLSIEQYNEEFKRKALSNEDILHILAASKEFENIKVRDEELGELEKIAKKYCPLAIKGGLGTDVGKANCLLQCYISNGIINSSTLNSDTYFISQSAGRISRALFEICLKQGRSQLATRLLTFCKMFDRRVWFFQHPLRQFHHSIKPDLIRRLENKKLGIDELVEMESNEISSLIHVRQGDLVTSYVNQIPYLDITAKIQPITRMVLKIELTINPNFRWNDRYHGAVEPFWIWVEDGENEHIYHHEYFLLHKKKHKETHDLTFTIPIFEPLPPQYFIRAVSDKWIGSDLTVAVSFKHLILPESHPPHTALLDLHPVPITSLHNKAAESMYSFTHYNPIQSQVFHTVYHTDENVLLGAPTGSGKTNVAEMAMLRLFAMSPGMKCVYIAPLKALARERIEGWGREKSFVGRMKKSLVELTGDTSPDPQLLKKADILITTPEKWDGISRSWQSRNYVKSVGLVIIDEIHLLGQDRGPVLEVIVSRMRYISTHTENNVRIVGLSTALANARDLADWLGIDGPGLFNFHPAVRPVPLTVYISGYPGKHYCPRMATMNKPTYAALTTHSPNKPALVFVSSRRQTRLTALDLITFSAADGNPRKFLHMEDAELQYAIQKVRDPNLKHMLAFGIGMHHAGLPARDRSVVEELFVAQKIQVLVCTSTLAWGVNFPAHLVVIKGTEYYDAKVNRYVDFPITDVLQMMGRAGRPQFDDQGKAVVLVHEPKKNFYMNFLHKPFPVESSLLDCLHDHMNAEVVGGTIASIQDAIDYLTWTFFFRRLIVNPSYYNLEDASSEGINEYLINLVRSTFDDLSDAGCLMYEDDDTVSSLPLGSICSYYYLSYQTVRMFSNKLLDTAQLPDLLDTLSSASEYDELPVRHNEDKLNEEMSSDMKWEVDEYTFDSPHTKANMLLQAHFSGLDLPVSDYITDQKSVLDQAIRILQAMVDVTAEAGWLDAALNVMNLTQMVSQGRWLTDSSLINLPHVSEKLLATLWYAGIRSLAHVVENKSKLARLLSQGGLSAKQSKDFLAVVERVPHIDVTVSVPQEKQELYAEDEGVVYVRMQPRHRMSKKAYTPRFPKPKREGWWAVVGCKDAEGFNELCALKRVFISHLNNTQLTFEVPETPGLHTFTFYLMSDTYLGIDQQYEFTIRVLEGENPGAQGDEGEYYEGDEYYGEGDEYYGEGDAYGDEEEQEQYETAENYGGQADLEEFPALG